MPSKKKREKRGRNASGIGWVRNVDGSHSFQIEKKKSVAMPLKSNHNWAELLKPEISEHSTITTFQTDEIDINYNISSLFEDIDVNEEDSYSIPPVDPKLRRMIEMMTNQLELLTLPTYSIPKEIWDAAKSGQRLRFDFPIEKFAYRNTLQNYLDVSNAMIHLEEATQTQFVESFDQKDVDFFHTGDNRICYFMNEKRMAEISAAIDENLLDQFVLTTHENIQFEGRKKSSNLEKIFVEINENCFEKFLKVSVEKSFDIHFVLNRTPFQLQHLALDFIEDHGLFDILINNIKYDCTGNEQTNVNRYEILDEPNLKLNPEQREAVRNIINGTSYPLPYLLFGPPGTGKTRTLTAAIEQIVKSTDKNVLVCAQTNAACDEIIERLLPILNNEEMFRMYARSFDAHKLKAEIEPYSNWVAFKDSEFCYPSMTFILKFRVVVCTLCTAGVLSRSGIAPSHFDYIIIDECASAHETMSLIAIAGLCTQPGKIHANIVVAGDPKQLDAVAKSNTAIELGYKTSFLEHLFKRPLYQRDPETKEFNGRYITQLVRNYRSHPSILKIPNELFYHSSLLCNASTDVTGWFINSALLPAKNFPVIFHSVQGISKMADVNKSLFNTNEIKIVMDYVKKLLNMTTRNGKRICQQDIGIVTPYKMQRRCIAAECNKLNLDEIVIGTAEVFQGQERPIMIVSTVRSGGNRLGFVNNPRRFNVMITRAKALLVVVGDPHLLRYDSNWKKFINFILENKGMIQSHYRYP